ncbi:MAG: 50S ribosomal protein L15 [Chloroflexi bacterium]|nr:50S ribosomal protein L15 [Chloroflexota bacterium]
MSLDPSQLRPPQGATHAKKRVGRGNSSGHGTYSGKGLKGQKSRSGKGVRAGFEGGQMPIVRKMHVLRGFNNKWRVEYQPINLSSLERFADGTVVTPETLKEAGLLRHLREPVKVLARGELTRKLTVTAHGFSAAAKARIEELGGTAMLVEPDTEDGKEG